ncbi:MAG TPA: hypothetical protein VGR73_10800 [Bryobacteraceae bacterium]|nr:hypothetical protein [Bryobacteraceae bacterium]
MRHQLPSVVGPALIAVLVSGIFVESVAAQQVSPSSTPFGGFPTLPVAPPQAPTFFPDPATQAQFATVWSYLRLPSPLKFGDQYLSMLGDKSGFFIFCLTADRSPTSPNPAVALTAGEILTALDIIHKSFSMPKFIQNAGDRKPNSSLAVLKMFQAVAVDQTVKDRIVVETNFLNSVPQVIIPDPPAPLAPPPAPGTTPFR